jgi:hypothetical protein
LKAPQNGALVKYFKKNNLHLLKKAPQDRLNLKTRLSLPCSNREVGASRQP